MSDQYLPPQSEVVSGQDFENPPLFSVNGRIGRIRYLAHNFWVSMIIYAIGAVCLAAAAAVSESMVQLVSILLLVPLAAVLFIFTIKRCHDIDISGWWSLLSLIPILNLFFAFKSGTPTANRYGPIPGPNTVLLWLGAIVIPLAFFVGVLAAIAIPAYQDYATRAQIGVTYVAAHEIRNTLAAHRQNAGEWPAQNDLAALGLGDPKSTDYATIYAHPDTGVIEVVMLGSSAVAPAIANGTLIFAPRFDAMGINYDCTSEDIDQRFLGSSCTELVD